MNEGNHFNWSGLNKTAGSGLEISEIVPIQNLISLKLSLPLVIHTPGDIYKLVYSAGWGSGSDLFSGNDSNSRVTGPSLINSTCNII